MRIRLRVAIIEVYYVPSMMNNSDSAWSLPVSAHSGNEVPMSAINAATKPINTFAIKYMFEHAVDDEDDDTHCHDINDVYRGYFAPACELPRMVQEAPEAV